MPRISQLKTLVVALGVVSSGVGVIATPVYHAKHADEQVVDKSHQIGGWQEDVDGWQQANNIVHEAAPRPAPVPDPASEARRLQGRMGIFLRSYIDENIEKLPPAWIVDPTKPRNVTATVVGDIRQEDRLVNTLWLFVGTWEKGVMETRRDPYIFYHEWFEKLENWYQSINDLPWKLAYEVGSGRMAEDAAKANVTAEVTGWNELLTKNLGGYNAFIKEEQGLVRKMGIDADLQDASWFRSHTKMKATGQRFVEEQIKKVISSVPQAYPKEWKGQGTPAKILEIALERIGNVAQRRQQIDENHSGNYGVPKFNEEEKKNLEKNLEDLKGALGILEEISPSEKAEDVWINRFGFTTTHDAIKQATAQVEKVKEQLASVWPEYKSWIQREEKILQEYSVKPAESPAKMKSAAPTKPKSKSSFWGWLPWNKKKQ